MAIDCEPYEILGEIGRGGMGVVYRARDPILDRIVAIKMIRTGGIQENAVLQERLLREGRSAASLSHPNVVSVYQMVKKDDNVYIVMEFVDGPTLEQWLATDPPPSRDAILDVLRQIAAGLDYAHRRGIVHRDIKPMNILIDEAGTARITDFGLAKAASSAHLTQTGMQVGTPHYVSPEQARGILLDGRTDQFSLAVVAFEALTGKRPFEADEIPSLMYKIVFEQPPLPHELNARLGTAVDAVFSQAFAKDPGGRFPACVDFVKALEAACAISPPAMTLPLPPSPKLVEAPPPAKRFNAKLAGIAAAASVALVIVAGGALFRNRAVEVARADAVAVAPIPPPVPAPVVEPEPAPAPARPAVPKTGSASREKAADVAATLPPRKEPEPVAEKPARVVEPVVVAKGMADWEKPDEWRAGGGWLVHKGGNIVPYGVTPLAGNLTFAATLLKGKRLQWVLNMRDPKNYALYQVEKKQLIVKDVVNGSDKERAKVPIALNDRGSYHFLMAISPHQIVTSIYARDQWTVLDIWEQPDRDVTSGKFGFLIPGSDEVGIANFSFTPKRN